MKPTQFFPRGLTLALACLVMLACAAQAQAAGAKYVLLFIGDGMGIPQRMATEMMTGKRMLMDTFPAQGITTTSANDRFITGSAAAATALASGQKTNINFIGVDPNLTPVKTVAELAKEQGKKVGIVTSVSIDHATPAAFYAHVKTRKMMHEIDHALANSGFDFFGGGGMVDPTGKKSKAPMGDALEAARKNGYTIVSNKADFMKIKPGDGRIIAWNEWLQDAQALPYAMDMTDKDITLSEFTSKAIEMLDNDKGFFLMVEGGKIDWACHANDAAAALRNNIAFDDAVAQGVAFARKHPNDTLIVVTGDHECGGLTLGFAGTNYNSYFDLLGSQKVSFQKFTDQIIPAFKKKANSSYDAMKSVISANFGLKFVGDSKTDKLVLTPFEQQQIEAAFKHSMDGKVAESQENDLLYGGYEPLSVALTHILNQKAGLGWTSYKHTGVPVSTSAMGVGAETFNGYYDNVDVAMKIMRAMGVTPKVYKMARTDTAAVRVAAN
jgi:alkaline phosphatase